MTAPPPPGGPGGAPSDGPGVGAQILVFLAAFAGSIYVVLNAVVAGLALAFGILGGALVLAVVAWRVGDRRYRKLYAAAAAGVGAALAVFGGCLALLGTMQIGTH